VIMVKVVTFKLPEELLKELDAYAMNHRLSRSDVIREALEYFLERNYAKRREII